MARFIPERVGRPVGRGAVCCCLVVLAIAGWQTRVGAQTRVPPEFHGRWVPAKAACESAVAVVVSVDRLTLVNGKDAEALAGIEMAGPGFFPPGYSGIMAVLITSSMVSSRHRSPSTSEKRKVWRRLSSRR